MVQRLAATLALIVFAVCLIVGGLETGNSFTSAVWRALVAMFWTYVIGLVLGAMGQRMLNENLNVAEEKLKESEQNLETSDR